MYIHKFILDASVSATLLTLAMVAIVGWILTVMAVLMKIWDVLSLTV